MSAAARDHWYLTEYVPGWTREDAATNHGVTIRKTTLFGQSHWTIDWGGTATAGCRTEAKAIRAAQRARELRQHHDAKTVSAVADALTTRWPPGWEPNGNWYQPTSLADQP